MKTTSAVKPLPLSNKLRLSRVPSIINGIKQVLTVVDQLQRCYNKVVIGIALMMKIAAKTAEGWSRAR